MNPPAHPSPPRKFDRKLIGSTLLALALGFGAIILLATVPALDGKPILSHMSGLIQQSIVTAGLIICAALPLMIKTHKNTEVTREEVKNNHTTNLREESDERHLEILTVLDQVVATQKGQATTLSQLVSSNLSLHTAVNRLENGQTGTNARVQLLEKHRAKEDTYE